MAQSEEPRRGGTRVVTRGGDTGETALGRGVRVAKSDARVEAYGTIDEASSVLGVVRALAATDTRLDARLRQVQVDLFNIAADLHMPGEQGAHLRFPAEPVQRIEAELEAMNAELPELKNFLLPGGALAAAQAHVARTLIRRAERRAVTLNGQEAINPAILSYLNRLADYLFVVARHLNDDGARDEVWAPRTQTAAG